MADALKYFDPCGFCITNRSLNGNGYAKQMFFPLGAKTTYHYQVKGSELTWDLIQILGIPWGDNSVIKYDQCTSGWKYEWDLNIGTFTVTDVSGKVEVRQNITTLSDAAICWDIFYSDQFSIQKTITLESDDHALIAGRIDSKRPTECASFSWGTDYLLGVQHAIVDFLVGYAVENPESMPESTVFSGSGLELYNLLLAYVGNLQVSEDYPLNLYPGGTSTTGRRESIERAGYLQTCSFLMIFCFASQLLSSSSKIVYEPWMLWEIFKWLYQRPNVVQRNTIFDLSPWWG
jgi:hypothetical protein